MNPIDVCRTRFYNQAYVNGKGVIYSSGFDAFNKIARNEGFNAFYKGFLTHFLRIGPHFCLTFVFLGVLRRNLKSLYSHLDQRESFLSFDLDGDGKLCRQEVRQILEKVALALDDPFDPITDHSEVFTLINRRFRYTWIDFCLVLIKIVTK